MLHGRMALEYQDLSVLGDGFPTKNKVWLVHVMLCTIFSET